FVQSVRKTFDQRVTYPLSWRKKQIRGIHKLLVENESEICDALYKDLKKPQIEAILFEFFLTKAEAVLAVEKLDEWAAPEYVSADPIVNGTDTCEIRRQPLGVVLIIAPWNYPVHLTLCPLVSALAAGNAVILKPSEMTPHVAAVLADLIPKYLDPSAVKVINGGIDETTAVLQNRFDHIFYTGNGAVGKIIMAAASKHLTPVTLELGGKSPVIIDEDVDPLIVAKRILWAKTVNSGQTCIAPDFLLCNRKVLPKLLEGFKGAREQYFGDALTSASTSVNKLSRIVNVRHFQRLASVLKQQTEVCPSSKIVMGGEMDEKDLFFAPTLITGVGKDPEKNPVMREEIFGPLLPIIEIDSIDEAIEYVNSRDKPLTLTIFSKNKKVVERVLENTSSGTAMVNDLLMFMS
ncbi:Aldehyde dehydrogenase, partial [Quaeritorhiza haematococci]